MRVGIVGAGLQGRRRALALQAVGGSELVIVADVSSDSATNLGKEAHCLATTRWEELISRDDLDAVVVCTPPHLHAPVSIAAMEHGKHVLCEKPLARNSEEAQEMVRTAREAGVRLKCGFNLRYHPALVQARHWLQTGVIGEIDWIRSRYGTGGRPGYDREWRAKAEISGGGQLMDQGIHLLDLCRWFLGDFSDVFGFLSTRFWDVAPLEDNAFVLLRTPSGQIASLHTSWTEWKPRFSFEISGHDGYISIEGLGGAYGTERVALGRRDFDGPFGEESIEFRRADRSWEDEWREFEAAIAEGREPSGNGADGLAAIQLAERIYESSKSGRTMTSVGELQREWPIESPGNG